MEKNFRAEYPKPPTPEKPGYLPGLPERTPPSPTIPMEPSRVDGDNVSPGGLEMLPVTMEPSGGENAGFQAKQDPVGRAEALLFQVEGWGAPGNAKQYNEITGILDELRRAYQEGEQR